jgi:hypothetical protein
VRRTLPPSAEIEAQIDQLLGVGVGENPRQSLSELAKLGARLIIQRAVEDEFDAWLGRARYERRPDYQRGLRNFDSGLRNGYRPRRVQTAEGELKVEIPQVREAAEPFVSALFPHSTKLLRTQPLEAMVVGAFVRGLSMRDVESLCEEAGAREALEVDRLADLHRATRALRGLQAPRPLPGEARRPVPRCDLPQRQTQGPEGGRALRLGLFRTLTAPSPWNGVARRASPETLAPDEERARGSRVLLFDEAGPVRFATTAGVSMGTQDGSRRRRHQ